MGLRLRLVLLLLVPMILVVAVFAYVRLQRGARTAAGGVRSARRRHEHGDPARRGARAPERHAGRRQAAGRRPGRQADRDRPHPTAGPEPRAARRLEPPRRRLRACPSTASAGPGYGPAGRRASTRAQASGSTPCSSRSGLAGAGDGVLEVAYVAGRLEADLLGENYKIAAARAPSSPPSWASSSGLALQRLVFRPVADLTQGIERVVAGEPRATVPVRSRDELGQVAAAFNRMTERLEDARQRVEAETDRSLELMRRLRQTESLAIAGKLCSSIAHEVGHAAQHHRGPRRADASRAAEGLAAPGGPRRHRRPDRPDLPDDSRRPGPLPPARARAGRHRASGRSPRVLRPLLQHFARSRGVTLAVSMPRGPSAGARRSRASPAGPDQPPHERHRGDAGGRPGRGHGGVPPRRRRATGRRHRGAGHRVRDSRGRASPDLRPLLQHQAGSRGRRSRPRDLSGSRQVQRQRHPGGEHARRGHHLHRLASRSQRREAARREQA